ncbi:MAG: beta-N-acetylhexosaminidase [Deltaproteobacteria bacterium]|nr:beta-N-acetylhexosaminidase [Deltaproteobacteria bacterium]
MLERDFGRLFMVGFYGSEFSLELQAFIDAINPCGVILFARNILDPGQVAELNFAIQKFSIERLGRPILIGVDQEGGRVKRVKAPFSEFPPVMVMAGGESPEETIRRYAEITARELILVGFNLDFTPVLDVLGDGIDPANTVIGDRSFGSDPKQVAKFGALVIRTMKSEGLLTCGKHFPGHGAVAVDSHLDLPIDRRPIRRIMERDVLPFVNAIDAGTSMIMTAHVLFPAFDKLLPASLSPALVENLLRNELKFQGPIVTDDLDMGAISKHYSAEEASLLAYQAGADILLICNSPDKTFAARKNVFDSTLDDPFAEKRFKRSIATTEALFPSLLRLSRRCDSASVIDYFRSKPASA